MLRENSVRGQIRRFRALAGTRPPIPRAHVELIKRLSRENPGWGEDRGADELRLKLGIHHSTSTIRKFACDCTDQRPRMLEKLF